MSERGNSKITFKKKLIDIDYFAQAFKLKLSSERSVFGTMLGSVMTLLMVLTLILYGAI